MKVFFFASENCKGLSIFCSLLQVKPLFLLSLTDLLLAVSWLCGALLFSSSCDSRATCYNLHTVEQVNRNNNTWILLSAPAGSCTKWRMILFLLFTVTVNLLKQYGCRRLYFAILLLYEEYFETKLYVCLWTAVPSGLNSCQNTTCDSLLQCSELCFIWLELRNTQAQIQWVMTVGLLDFRWAAL